MYTPINEEFGFLDSIIVTLISILIVFLVLITIIVISGIFSKFIVAIKNKKNINPRIENKIIEEDEDALAAAVVASIDFYNETKKHARLVSITQAKEE